MASSVIIEEQVEIPGDIRSLADFRRWALSEEFPEQGRIDYIGRRIEVDMSPESIFSHGKLKVAIVSRLHQHVERGDLGHLVTDSTRVCVPQADLSVEPDVVFLSHESLASGRVHLVPKSGATEDFVEVEGPADLIVEIVSDASVTKDTVRLPVAYAKAGVPEFWLADARRQPHKFQIYHLAEGRYVAAEPDAEGFQPSRVFGRRFRLDGRRDSRGFWKFDLVVRE